MNLGYKVISYEDLIQYNNGNKKLPQKVFLLSFDDGNEDNYEILFPIIKKYNIPIAINIVDENIGKEGCLTWEQIREMRDSGLVSIFSHGKNHERSDKVSTDQFVDEIEYAYDSINEHTHAGNQKVYTYPYGIYDEEKIKALEEKGFIQNLTDNKINNSNNLNMSKLHRCYPLNDSVEKILIKMLYRQIRYK